jgi:hypothetical protein
MTNLTLVAVANDEFSLLEASITEKWANYDVNLFATQKTSDLEGIDSYLSMTRQDLLSEQRTTVYALAEEGVSLKKLALGEETFFTPSYSRQFDNEHRPISDLLEKVSIINYALRYNANAQLDKK